MESLDISVIIVNYNTTDLIRNCLKSLYLKTKGVKFEVFVVDNCSKIKPLELKEEFPGINLILSDKNLGFGGANNLALTSASAKYIFFLNPDTIILNNVLKFFLDFMEKPENLNIAAAGAYLLGKNQRITFSAGNFLSIYKRIKDYLIYLTFKIKFLKRIFKFIINSYLKPVQNTIMDLSDCVKVDFISGADLFVRMDVLKQTGFFDESFFMYSEEMDLQYRMAGKGLERVLIKGPEIIHLEGQSFTKISNLKRIMISVSNILYAKKHYSFGTYILFKTLILIFAVIETIIDVFVGEYTFGENIFYMTKIFKEEFK